MANPRAVSFAHGIAADDRRRPVVVDLPADTGIDQWDAVARMRATRPDPIGLVLGRSPTPIRGRSPNGWLSG